MEAGQHFIVGNALLLESDSLDANNHYLRQVI